MEKQDKQTKQNKKEKKSFADFVFDMFGGLVILSFLGLLTWYVISITLPIIEYVLPIVISIFMILYLIWNYTNK